MKRSLTVFALVLLLIAGSVIVVLEIVRSFGGPRVARSNIPPPVVVSLAQPNAPLRVFPGVAAVLMILPDGSLWRWGSRQPANWGRAIKPERIGTNCAWAKAYAANNHCLALQTNGSLWEWGWRGNVGTAGRVEFSAEPQPVDTNMDWGDIAAGDIHSIALKRDGTLWGWGDNTYNQLGTAPGTSFAKPVQIGSDKDWSAIACGQGSSAYALKKNGTLWLWGQARVGLNTQTIPRPTQVCRESNWVSLFPSAIAPALTRSGEIWSPDLAPPSADAAATASCRLFATDWMPNYSAIAFCGSLALYSIRPDHTLWKNSYSFRISDWKWLPSKTWRQVGNRSDWISLWGDGTAIGLTSDGTVWTWGTDPGQKPIPDTKSRITMLDATIRSWLGKPPSSVGTSALSPYQPEPRPLMQLLFTNAELKLRQ